MVVSFVLTDAQKNHITKSRLLECVNLSHYMDRMHCGVCIENGEVVEWDNTPGVGGSRVIRTATKLDHLVFHLLREMGID